MAICQKCYSRTESARARVSSRDNAIAPIILRLFVGATLDGYSMTPISVSDTPAAEIPHRDWKRLDGVDVLRGLAILFVALNHVNMRLVSSEIPYAVGFSRSWVAALVWNGQFGVQIFFAVSGFLITSTTLRRWGQLSHVSLRDFYLLRVARIVPLLLALLLILIGLHFAGVRPFVVTQEMGGLGRAIFAALTLHVNVLQARHGWLPANWGVLWSLSVEEVFYLFFPLMARIFGRGILFVVILLCFAMVGPFARTVLAHGNDVWSEQSYLGGMDAIALGCLTALLVRKARFSEWALRVLAVIGAALILFTLVGLRIVRVPLLMQTGLDMTVIAVGTCLVMIATAQTQWKAPRLLRPLMQLGQRSYEVYLTHMFVVFALFGIFMSYAHPAWAVLPLFLLTTLVAAIAGDLVARYFSEPVNRVLRQRWSEGPRQLGSVSDS
jgi:peptidoglycan/LPS O-acetylase OafA/YrhL